MTHVRMRSGRASGGYTLGELVMLMLVGVVVSVVVAGVMLPGLGGRKTCCSRQLKDSTQIRGVIQAMIIWAGNNNGQYPLPGAMDVAGDTIGGDAESKNTTGNILSVMVFNSSISPEICVNPAEVNAQISTMMDYQYSNPKAAVTPDRALWDPRFRGTPIDGGVAGESHQSYAHVVPVGVRRDTIWLDTYSSTQPVFGNRGPMYLTNDCGNSPGSKWTLVPGPLGDKSNTLQIHGGRSTWEGNIGFNDGSVSFQTSPTPADLTYKVGGPKSVDVPDNLFVNEDNETDGDLDGAMVKGVNAYLRPVAEVKNPRKPTVWRD